MIAMATAQYGMLAAQRRFGDSAERVARMGAGDAHVDLTQELVAQAVAVTDFAANARVLQGVAETSRRALDILA
jgi:hypothetical protein